MKANNILRKFGCLILFLFLAACSVPTDSVPPVTQTATSLPDIVETPDVSLPPAIEAARLVAAEQANVGLEAVEILEYQEAEWPDSCLGMSAPDEICSQALTPGYVGKLKVGEEKYEFRTDQSGAVVRLIPGAGIAARNFLAEELGLNQDLIRIIEIEAVEWPDSCLGVSGRGACAEVITPGYRVVLDADNEVFLVHTDLLGTTVILAGTPDVPNTEARVFWTGFLGDACLQVEITPETLAHGPCDGETNSTGFVGSPRFNEFQELTGIFKPFIADTSVGEVQVSGPGAVTPSADQQRMFAEWARLVAREAVSGETGGIEDIPLIWRREGGESSFCDQLQLDVTGDAVGSSCLSGNVQELGRTRLTSTQLKQLYFWLDSLRSYELETTQLLEAGAITTRIQYSGRGEDEALDVHQRDMDAFAQKLFTHLSQPQDDAEIEAARQSLNTYLEALNSGRYADAAAVFGGDIQILQKHNPDIPSEDHAAQFQGICSQDSFQCELTVLNEVSAAKISPTKFRFVVELQSPDGQLFILKSDPSYEAMMTQLEFYVENVDGHYVVITLPLFSG